MVQGWASGRSFFGHGSRKRLYAHTNTVRMLFEIQIQYGNLSEVLEVTPFRRGQGLYITMGR